MELKIKSIVFDIGGVMNMHGNMKNHYQELFNSMNIDEKRFFYLRNKYLLKASTGKLPAKKMISLIAKDMKLDKESLYKNWGKYKRKSIVKNWDLEKIIIKLMKKGYKIGSMSNVLDLHYKLCKEKNIYDVFDFNIISCKAGLIKPDVRIYKLLLNKLKLQPQEVIFIDDVNGFLAPAKKMGIKTVLFKNNKQLVKELKKFGVNT